MKNTLIAVAIVALLIVGGARVYTAGPSEKGPIKIGFIGPLTGDAASFGVVAKAGVELAIEEINAAGGINDRRIEAVYEDGQCSPTEASSAASKLMNIDKVTAILGGTCSTETSSFAPAAMQNKTVVLSYCSSAPSLSNTGEYFFRNYPSDLLQGKFMAEYAYNTLGARDMYIIYHTTDWGTGLKDVFSKRFQELGGTVVGVEGSAQEERDYKTMLTKAKASDATFIYAPMYPDGSSVAMKQAKDLDLKARFIGGDTWDDPKFQAAVAMLGTFIYPKLESPAADDFTKKVQAKTGMEEVVFCAAHAYDATHILANALSEAGTDPDKLADSLRATKYNGLIGHVEFDEHGDMKGGSYVARKIENGKSEVLR